MEIKKLEILPTVVKKSRQKPSPVGKCGFTIWRNKIQSARKAMNYCSRCHVRLAAPVSLSGNIHHDRYAPSIKDPERDLATRDVTQRAQQKRNHKSIVAGDGPLSSQKMRLQSYSKAFYETKLRQTCILVNPERHLMQQSLKQDRAVHNRSRWRARSSKYKYAIVCNTK